MDQGILKGPNIDPCGPPQVIFKKNRIGLINSYYLFSPGKITLTPLEDGSSQFS